MSYDDTLQGIALSPPGTVWITSGRGYPLPSGRRLGYQACWVTQASMKRHTFHNFEIYVVKLFVFMLVYGFVLGFIVYLLFTYVTMRQEQGWWVTQC